jgi:hypothetical protein
VVCVFKQPVFQLGAFMPIKKRAKIISALVFILGFCIATFLGSRRAQAYAEGPPPGHTGAPREVTCATSGCHDTRPANTGPGQFTITAPSSYQLGQTYQITVTHRTSEASRLRWGFQLTALTGGGTQAGGIQVTSSTTQLLSDDGTGFLRQYIEHSDTGTFPGTQGGASWTFNWVAPSSDVGPVSFYAAGNQANNDGLNTGDEIYTASAMTASAAPHGTPVILSASANRKHLFIMGQNFDDNSVIMIDGRDQPTATDGNEPVTVLIALKAVKKGRIVQGVPVMLTVRNSDGMESDPFPFTLQ